MLIQQRRTRARSHFLKQLHSALFLCAALLYPIWKKLAVQLHSVCTSNSHGLRGEILLAANCEVRFQLSGRFMHLVNDLAHCGSVFQCASSRREIQAFFFFLICDYKTLEIYHFSN